MNKFLKYLCGLCIGLLFLSSSFEVEATALKTGQPQLTVEKYEIVEGKFEKNGECTLRIYISNVDDSHDATAGAITMYSSTVYPVTGKSNQISFGTVGAGEQIYVDYEVSLDNLISGPNPIELNMTWADTDARRYDNSISIAPVLLENVGFEIIAIKLPNTVYGSTNTTLSVTYKNTGSENLQNIHMIVDGDLAQGKQVVEVDDLSVDGEKVISYSLELADKGVNSLTVAFRYEDRTGNEYFTEEEEVSVTVADGDYVIPEEEMDVWGFVTKYRVYFIASLVAIILWVPSVVSLVQRKKKKEAKKDD